MKQQIVFFPGDVTFAYNKVVLTSQAKATIEELVNQRGVNFIKTIEVVGYTDSEGNEEYNQKLSEKRAKSVADYLIQLGVPADRVTSWGGGESNPVHSNSTKIGRAKNRRVEMTITRLKGVIRFPMAPVSHIHPWTGNYAKFRALLDKAEIKAAGNLAQKWQQENLADVMALIALGEWYEKTGDILQAARAYSSLIDYFPARADIRRWAAERLLSIKSYTWLSIDSLEKAVVQRPEHPSGHYLLAIAYWDDGQYKKAVETLKATKNRLFHFQRFAGAHRILNETLAIMLTLLEQQQQLETLFPGQTFKWDKVKQSQLHLVLMWETDANNVDFYIYDNQQHHAFGTKYANITTGYGPEYFQISEPKAFPYKVQAHYENMGPMGYGMGVLHVFNYDLETGIRSEFRSFVVMKQGGFVELGTIDK